MSKHIMVKAYIQNEVNVTKSMEHDLQRYGHLAYQGNSPHFMETESP
jgi:hypothetical protein